MPNYSLILDTKFKPFSYQEMLAPVTAATQAHQAIEEEYGNLATKANIWNEMANEQTDPYAYKMYKNYANDLEEQAGRLAREGLNIASRKDMLNMRTRYSKEIVPIENAYNSRLEQIKEQRKGRAAGLIYNYDAATTSLDRYLENPRLSYDSIDKKDVYNKAITAFGSLAKELDNYGKGKSLDAYTNTWFQRHGITRNDASEFMTAIKEGRLNDANPVLKAIYNTIYDSTGVNKWDNNLAKQEIASVILDAVPAAIGQTQVNTFQNTAAIAGLRSGASRSSGSRPSYSNDRLSYRRMPFVSETDSESLARDKNTLNFLQGVINNPESVNLGVKTLPRSEILTDAIKANSNIERRPLKIGEVAQNENPNLSDNSYNKGDYNELAHLANEYDIDINFRDSKSIRRGAIEIYERTKDDLNKRVALSDVWQPNSTNISYITEPWVSAVQTIAYNAEISGDNNTGIVDADGKKVSYEDLMKIDSSTASYFTRIVHNKPITYLTYKEIGNKNKNKIIQLPKEALDMGDGGYNSVEAKVEQALNNQDYMSAAGYMDDIMEYFDASANTRAQTQSKTNSNLEFQYNNLNW